MENRFLVFLSGVINERTKPFRAIIKRDVEGPGWAHVWLFEKEPAHSGLKDSYLPKVDRSDLFALVLWDDITDIVEEEFQRASGAGIPILLFWVNTHPPSKKLSAFLERIRDQLKWSECKEDDLSLVVSQALISHLIDIHRARYAKQTLRLVTSPEPKGTPIESKASDSTPQEELALIASGVMPGRVVRAVHYVDGSDGRNRLAVLTSTTKHPNLYTAFVLVEFGGGHRIEWQSKSLGSGFPWCDPAAWFAAEDVDNDSRHEIFLAEGSHGTGSGADLYYLYVPAKQKLLHVTVEETRDPYYRTWAEPSPELLEPANEAYLKAIEARMKRFQVIVRDDSYQRSPDVLWYVDNGFLKTGHVTVRRFQGAPRFGASIIARHTDGDVEWYAFFKGPVMGHDLVADESFVVYGPATMYHWPTCFASSTDFLWFGTQGDGVFQYDKKRQLLTQIPSGALQHVALVESLELRGKQLIVNGTHNFDVPWL